tara:strand:- start:53721 stop:59300 length:5580 start_codon:yes stop_codon:yes gene_type:complete
MPNKDLNSYLNWGGGDFTLGNNTDPFDYGQDVNNRDYLDDGFTFTSDYDVAELRANRQPWSHKFARGVGRVGVKTVAEIAKMPGVLGGIVAGAAGQLGDLASGEDNTDFMQTAFNNAWVKSIEKAEHYMNTEGMPVYVEKAIKDGKLWDKITSVDFWATDGADGLGYVISMLVPGQAITKLQLGSKLSGLGKLAKMGKSTEKAVANLAKYGITPKNMDIGLAGLANTIFEAGAEARGAMDSYVGELDRRMQLPKGEEDYINADEYAQLLDKQSKIGANVFNANAGILLLPNMIMAKILWGKPRNKVKLPAGQSAMDVVPTPGIAKRIGNWGNDFAKATLREGFWEEGMQSTAEKYFTENPDADMGDFISDADEEYLKNLGSTDGQTAIFLGAVYGGTMQATMNSYQSKAEHENTNKLIPKGKSLISDYATFLSEGDIYVQDKDGNDIWQKNEDTGELKRELDPLKIQTKLGEKDEITKMSAIYDVAKATGNTDLVESLENRMYTDLVKPFIVNDNLGVEALKSALKENAELAKGAEDANIDADTIVEAITEKAVYLKEKYSNFQEFAPTLIKLQSKDATEADYDNFMNILTSKYLNAHSRKQFLDSKQTEKQEILNKVLAEKGYSIEDFKGENEKLRRDLYADTRVKKVADSLNAIESSLESTNTEIEQYWDPKMYNEAFRQYTEEARQYEAEAEKRDIATKKIEEINSTATLADLDKITFDEFDVKTQEVLEASREKRRESIIKLEAETIAAAKLAAEGNKTTKEIKEEEAVEQLELLKKNLKEGEVMIVPEWVKDYAGESATITKIHNKSVTVTTEDGKKINVKFSTLLKNAAVRTAITNTEGAVDSYNITEEERAANAEHDHATEDKNDSVVMSTDAFGVLFPHIDPAVLEWERNPKDKTGKTVRFKLNTGTEIIATEAELETKRENAIKNESEEKLEEINKYYDDKIKESAEKTANPRTYTFTDNQQKALDMFMGDDFSDIEFLINHLPLHAKLTSTIAAPLHSMSESSDKFNAIWEKTTKNLRTAIIKEVASGTPIEKLSTKIAGQKNGNLKIAEKVNGVVVENSVFDLAFFGGDINNIKTSDIFVVNELGILENNNTKAVKVRLNRELAPGELYVKIATAAGMPFYLKLNIKKTTDQEADLLYEMYKHRFGDIEEGARVRISDVSPELMKQVEDNFGEVLELMNVDIEDVTIKDLTDFLIWDGARKRKSQIRFYSKEAKEGATEKTQYLFVGEREYTKEQFLSEDAKDDFKFVVTNMKRHNIKFKKRANDSKSTKSLRNKAYLQYLLRNRILNTNAVVKEPTFQGPTNVYLQSFRLMNGTKLSKFNVGAPTEFSTKLRGNNRTLNHFFPTMYDSVVKLAGHEKGYVGGGEFYYRTSLLKGKGALTGNKANNSAARGNVIDELTRKFFTFAINRHEFIQAGKDQTLKQNKKGYPISFQEGYFNQLYDILEVYATEFDNRGYTIYSNVPAVAGSLGNTKRNNFGGTIDLLAYDSKKGHYVLIDLKTTSQDRSSYYNKKVDKYAYKKGDRIQLNAYRELLRQKMGLQVEEVLIMPLTTPSLDEENSMYEDLSIDSEGMFLEVDMSKSIYDLFNFSSREKTQRKGFHTDTLGDPDSFVFDPTQLGEEGKDKAFSSSFIEGMQSLIDKFKGDNPEPKKEPTQAPTNPAPAANLAIVQKIVEKFTTDPHTSKFPHQGTGKFYKIAGDVGYIVEMDKDFKSIIGVVSDFATAADIIQNWNKIFGTMPFTSINETMFMQKFNAVWAGVKTAPTVKNKINTAANTKKTLDKSFDLSELTDDQLSTVTAILAAEFLNAKNRKGFNALIKKNANKSQQEKVELMIDYLVGKQISLEDIKVKCGI